MKKLLLCLAYQQTCLHIALVQYKIKGGFGGLKVLVWDHHCFESFNVCASSDNPTVCFCSDLISSSLLSFSFNLMESMSLRQSRLLLCLVSIALRI